MSSFPSGPSLPGNPGKRNAKAVMKKHICPVCERGFSTAGHLGRHAQIHTNERTHECPFPGCRQTECAHQDNLQQHYRGHLSRETPAPRNLRYHRGDWRKESPPIPDGPPNRPPTLRQSSSGVSRRSSIGGTSDFSSDQFSDSHCWQSEWNLPNYDVPAHQLVLNELDLTGEVTKLDAYPFDSGGVADIYRGMLRTSGSPVAIKIFRRMHAEPEMLEKTSRSLYEEARIWRRLEHPNILSILGIALDLGLSPALVSPLCTGPIMKYVQQNSKNPQEKLQMVIGVATGLSYLHSEGIVHGNLCTKKILVYNDGIPVICGYGMSKTLGQPAHTTSLLSSPIRFTPPESFSEAGTPSIQITSRDVYSFSMVALEILSELEPFHHLSTEHAVFMHILRGGQPIRTQLNPETFTNSIWRLLDSLWDHNPLLRPGMSDVLASLYQIRRDDPGRREKDYIEHKRTSLYLLHLEARRTTEYPVGRKPHLRHDTSLSDIHGRDLTGRVTQDDQYPFAGGGNSNIYRGKLARTNGRKIRVAIKMIRMSDDGSSQLEDILRRLDREVEIWVRLKHKNVLPLIGICNDIGTLPTPWPVLISPFHKFGHIGTYLKKYPSANRQDLVSGAASGLQYLHAHDIIHGDLKVQNVLVDKRGAPCICDFGISKIINRRGFTTSSLGTAPYMAPELFIVVDGPAQESSPTTTKSSDVYSFGLLVLEILTSQPPKGRPSRSIVTVKTLNELRPKRADYDEIQVPEGTWSVLNLCWTFEPHLRPTITEVLRALSTDASGTSKLAELPDEIMQNARPPKSLSPHEQEFDEQQHGMDLDHRPHTHPTASSAGMGPPTEVPQRDAQQGGVTSDGGRLGTGARALNTNGMKPECSNCGATYTPLWRHGFNDKLNCNACGLYYKLHKRPRPMTMRNTGGGGEGRGQLMYAAAADGMGAIQCYNCHTTSTPLLRKHDTDKTICNACELHGSLSQNSLKSNVIRKRSRHEACSDGASSCYTSSSSCPATSSASAGCASPSYNEQHSDVLPFARVKLSEIAAPRASKCRRLNVDSASEPLSSADIVSIRNASGPGPRCAIPVKEVKAAGSQCTRRSSMLWHNTTTATPPLTRSGARTRKTRASAMCICGLYYKLYGSARPISMKSDVIRKRLRHDTRRSGGIRFRVRNADCQPRRQPLCVACARLSFVLYLRLTLFHARRHHYPQLRHSFCTASIAQCCGSLFS
ncbi:Glycoside hydrolase family 76 protein [Mycena venus]|uniref:Glycoside hydrolase family 76 protein n=1 Tax=Mycena venus TaxID=2733690 RepID=A0A8H6XPA5_9AGAR|nr:Glycoside hydrolase family 76 protein [Mycena venus]